VARVDASAAGRVIAVGSINVDLVLRLPRLPSPGETVLGGALARYHGGKGANQAVAAARAGARVVMIGAVGAQDGADAAADLQAEGIDVTHVARCQNTPTGLAAVLVDATSGENQIGVAAGANDLVTVDMVDDAMESLGLGPGDVVVLCFELPSTPLRLAADLARYTGARLVVNPAPAQPDYAEVMTGAIVTPNEHELAAYVSGNGLDTRARAVQLSRDIGAPVIVTLGARGALLAEGDTTEHVRGYRVDAVDTTGAGDTLTGVLAAGLAAGLPLRESLRRAIAAAALAVTAPGARAAIPAAGAIDRLLQPG
jgi:ribokinase